MADNLKREAGGIDRYCRDHSTRDQPPPFWWCDGKCSDSMPEDGGIDAASDGWRVRRGKLLCPRCAGAETQWAVYDQNGTRVSLYRDTRHEAQRDDRYIAALSAKPWRHWYRNGYRCRRVTVYREDK